MIISSALSPNHASNNPSWNSMQRKPPPKSKPPTPISNSAGPSFKSYTLNRLSRQYNNTSNHQQSNATTNRMSRNQSSLGFNHFDTYSNNNKQYSTKLQHDIYAPASIANPNELHYKRPTDLISTQRDNPTVAQPTSHYSTSVHYNSTSNQSSKSKTGEIYAGRSSAFGNLFERFGSSLRRRRKSKTNDDGPSSRSQLPEAEKIYAEGLQALEGNAQKRFLEFDKDETILSEGETRTLVDEISKQQEDYKLLVNTLVNWINDELASDRLIVRDLQDDIYDGQVLSKLIEKLQNIKIDAVEVTQNADTQKMRLRIVLDHILRILSTQAKRTSIRWTLEGIHSKDMVEIVYLLTTLALIYRAPIRIPPNVRVRILVVHKYQGQLIKRSHEVQLTETESNLAANKDDHRDVFDTLMEFAPEKLIVVKQSLVKFVNRHLNKVNINISPYNNDILDPSKFSDGILLVLLISSLEDYFVPLGNLFTTKRNNDEASHSNDTNNNIMPETAIKPTSYTNTQPIQKLHNVNFAFQLLEDAGIMVREKVRPEDIVNGDLKSVLRVIYAIFSRYKNM